MLSSSQSKSDSGETNEKVVVLFDGDCGFCRGIVSYLETRDRHRRFFFLSSQSKEAAAWIERYRLENRVLQSVVVIERGETYLRSGAAIRILRGLGGGWRLVGWVLGWVPRPVRDWFYDRVAERRRCTARSCEKK